MSKLAEEYLKHILEECKYLLAQAEDLSLDEFLQDETKTRAFARSLEVIGEAAKQTPEDFRLSHPEVDWKSMAGMRDRLIHHYFGVDYEIVWDVVSNEIQILRDQISLLLGN